MNRTITITVEHRERCCVVIAGARCAEPSDVRISDGHGEAPADVHACTAHVALIYRPGQVVTFLDRR
jgi:hypothetical protein